MSFRNNLKKFMSIGLSLIFTANVATSNASAIVHNGQNSKKTSILENIILCVGAPIGVVLIGGVLWKVLSSKKDDSATVGSKGKKSSSNVPNPYSADTSVGLTKYVTLCIVDGNVMQDIIVSRVESLQDIAQKIKNIKKDWNEVHFSETNNPNVFMSINGMLREDQGHKKIYGFEVKPNFDIHWLNMMRNNNSTLFIGETVTFSINGKEFQVLRTEIDLDDPEKRLRLAQTMKEKYGLGNEFYFNEDNVPDRYTPLKDLIQKKSKIYVFRFRLEFSDIRMKDSNLTLSIHERRNLDEEIIPEMTSRQCFEEYTGIGGLQTRISQYLREKRTDIEYIDSKKLDYIINGMKKFFEDSKTPKNCPPVYRGITYYALSILLNDARVDFPEGSDVTALENVSQEKLDEINRIQPTIFDPGVLSTSFSKEYVLNHHLNGKVVHGHVVFTISVPEGYPAVNVNKEGLKTASQEQELTLRFGTKLKINKIERVKERLAYEEVETSRFEITAEVVA